MVSILSVCLSSADCCRRKVGKVCTYGSRTTEMHLINGAVLPLLKCLEGTVKYSDYGRDTSTGKKVPDCMLPAICLTSISG